MSNQNKNSRETNPDESLAKKIDAQRSHGGAFRPTTGLERNTGHEISRTGRHLDARNIKGIPNLIQEGEDPFDDETLLTKDSDLKGQNPEGGKSNR